MYAVIADDFTGAAEIAGICLRYGLRVELEGWGGSLTMFTMNNDQVIALTCYGEREYFDEIALTIRPLD